MSKLSRIIFKVCYQAVIVGLLVIFLPACDIRYGLLESMFQLAPESRLPRWIDVSGYQRNDLTMAINLYTNLFLIGQSNTQIIIYGPPPERKKIIEIPGRVRWHPFSEKDYDTKYPSYIIITVNGCDEVFEKKRPGDILYITDDPKVTTGYRKEKGCTPM